MNWNIVIFFAAIAVFVFVVNKLFDFFLSLFYFVDSFTKGVTYPFKKLFEWITKPIKEKIEKQDKGYGIISIMGGMAATVFISVILLLTIGMGIYIGITVDSFSGFIEDVCYQTPALYLVGLWKETGSLLSYSSIVEVSLLTLVQVSFARLCRDLENYIQIIYNIIFFCFSILVTFFIPSFVYDFPLHILNEVLNGNIYWFIENTGTISIIYNIVIAVPYVLFILGIIYVAFAFLIIAVREFCATFLFAFKSSVFYGLIIVLACLVISDNFWFEVIAVLCMLVFTFISEWKRIIWEEALEATIEEDRKGRISSRRFRRYIRQEDRKQRKELRQKKRLAAKELFKVSRGENLRQARVAAGLKRKEAAQKAGIAAQDLLYIETDRVLPDDNLLSCLCNIYNIDINDIITSKKIISKAYKTVCIAAIVLAAVVCILFLVNCYILSYTDANYLTDYSDMFTKQKASSLILTSEKIKEKASALAMCGFIGIFVFVVATRVNIAKRIKLVYMLSMSASVLVGPYLFALTNLNGVISIDDYIMVPWFIVIFAWLIFVCLCLIEHNIDKRRRKNKELQKCNKP